MTTATPQKSNKRMLTIGWLLAAVYAIGSTFAMNDLWKCYVDNEMGFFNFGDPERFCNSGMLYMYITLGALAGSLICFLLAWRKSTATNWILPAIVAAALIIPGCYFLVKPEPWDVRFTDYIEMKFYPFWCF